MTVRAKFRYTQYTAGHTTREPVRGEHGIFIPGDTVEVRTMTFTPIRPHRANARGYRLDDPNENALFWDGSAQGEIRLSQVLPEAWSQFTMGKVYSVDFTEE